MSQDNVCPKGGKVCKYVYSVFIPPQVTSGFDGKPSWLSIRLARLRWRILCLLGLRKMEDW